MKDYLKVYKAKLHVLSPTFVGSGKEISKKEYRLSYADQKVIVYDPAKFYQLIAKNNKTRQYEDFLLNEKVADLYSWLKNNRLNFDEINDAVRYTVDFGDSFKIIRTHIMEFSKDAYGNPYVPGSSLKGILRTILLDYEIRNDTDRFADKSNAKMIETEVFNTCGKDKDNLSNAVNDVLQGLIVSDSKPLKNSDLVLCQKIDLNIEKQENKLNIMRECIKPGTAIEFDITIDTSICKYDSGLIMKAINEFNNMYYECFLSKFDFEQSPDDTVYLGGGVGFVAKTYIYPLLGYKKGLKETQNILQKSFKRHGHFKDIKIGVSPHILKCTRYQGSRYQMGMCKFTMTEVKES